MKLNKNLCVFFVWVFLTSLPVLSQVGPIPSQVLLKKNTDHGFIISPNGKYFAKVQDNEPSGSTIFIIDIDGYSLYKTIEIRFSLDDIHWLSSNRIMYEALGEVFAVDIDGQNNTQLVSRLKDNPDASIYTYYKNYRFNNVISTLPENDAEVLIETHNHKLYAGIEGVNVFTAQKYTIMNGKKYRMNKWITDLNGNPRLGLRYEDESINFYSKNDESDEWELFEVMIDGKPYAPSVKADTYLNQKIVLEGFGYDPDILYLNSNVNSDKRRLLKYSLSEDKVIETLVADINCDVDDNEGGTTTILFDDKNKSLAGVRYEGLTPQYVWFSEEFKKVQQSLSEKYANFINEILDYDKEQERFVVLQWSDTYAGNVGIFNKVDGSYAVMFQFNEELNKYTLSKTKLVTATARDGYKIPCYLNLPIEHSSLESMPLIVMPHGGPWARDYWELDVFAQYFASRGYGVLRVNFRGSTGFGTNHVKQGMESIDGIMIDDVVDSTMEVSGKHHIDKNRIFIYGHSYGGYAAYMSLYRYPEFFNSAVAVSAPTDIKSWMKIQKKSKNDFNYNFWETALGSKDSKYLKKISPITHVDKIKTPLMIFHGKKDRIIPMAQATEMEAALKKSGADVKLEIFKTEGHSFSDGNSLGYLLKLADEFFKQHF